MTEPTSNTTSKNAVAAKRAAEEVLANHEPTIEDITKMCQEKWPGCQVVVDKYTEFSATVYPQRQRIRPTLNRTVAPTLSELASKIREAT